jgi:hypothetical protein
MNDISSRYHGNHPFGIVGNIQSMNVVLFTCDFQDFEIKRSLRWSSFLQFVKVRPVVYIEQVPLETEGM